MSETKSLGIGVIGHGEMASDHAFRLSRSISGAHVAGIAGRDVDRARAAAADMNCARVFESPGELIWSDDVDAVLVASVSEVHLSQVLEAIAARKPVFCEKPLALNARDAYTVVQAEHDAGVKLVTVGFMRRFDPELSAMQLSVASGEVGRVSVANCKHRNVRASPATDDSRAIDESAVHDFDTLAFLLGESVTEVQVVKVGGENDAEAGLHDPMLIICRTTSGILATVELYLNAGSGYEVRLEILGTSGCMQAGNPSGVVYTQVPGGGWGGKHFTGFSDRFDEAFNLQLRAWVEAVREGIALPPTAATAWDGYVAAATCDAAKSALRSTTFERVKLLEQPSAVA